MADKPKVIKLAQPGYDARTASDENLIFNSNWPLLKIYQQGKVTITGAEFDKTHLLAKHDLPFNPFFIYTSNGNWNDLITNLGPNKERAEFQGVAVQYIGINQEGLWYVNALDTPQGITGSVEIYYYIFAFSLGVTGGNPYIAPSVKVGSQSAAAGGGKTVFKLAKEGKDTSSRNLEDYVVHSDARSPLLHSKYYVLTVQDPANYAGYGYVFNHNLGYTPMFFAFVQGIGDYSNMFVPLYTTSGGDNLFRVDDQKIIYARSIQQVLSVVILKDPFDIDYTVKVSI